MAKTAFITGATGLLGRQVVKAFEDGGWKAVGAGFSRGTSPAIVKLDLLNQADVAKTLDDIRPDVVVHCAANRSPDSCTSNPDAARALNVTVSGTLADLTSSRGIFLIYISTDYVFSGRPGEAPYQPNSTPDPPNTYGRTKLDGEKAVLEASGKHEHSGEVRRPLSVVLRVPILYGACEENDPSQSAVNILVAQVKAAQLLKPNEPKIKVDDYAQRYPTNTEDVGRVCRDISNLYTREDNKSENLPRVLQFSSEDKMTKWKMVQQFAEILALPLDNMEPHRPSEEEQDKGVRRPYDCHLDSAVLRELGVQTATTGFTSWWRWELRAFRH